MRFSLPAPALQQAPDLQDPMQLPFPRCCIWVLSSDRSIWLPSSKTHGCTLSPSMPEEENLFALAGYEHNFIQPSKQSQDPWKKCVVELQRARAFIFWTPSDRLCFWSFCRPLKHSNPLRFFSYLLLMSITSSLGRDRSDNTHGEHPAQQELLCCEQAHGTWEGGMTWHEVTGRQAAKAWENHHACVFVFLPVQQKRLVNSSWMGFRNSSKKKKILILLMFT